MEQQSKIEDIYRYYNTLIDSHSAILKHLKRRIYHIGTLRLLLIVGVSGVLWLLRDMDWGILVLLSVVFLLAFLFLVVYHSKLFEKRHFEEGLIRLFQNELKALDYDFSAFDGASEQIDTQHPFSMDLDIFGDGSLFQSINRTVTQFGKESLVARFKRPLSDKNEILMHQESVAEMKESGDFRHHFYVSGEMASNEKQDIKRLFSADNTSCLSESRTTGVLIWLVPAIWILLITGYMLHWVPVSFFFVYLAVCFPVANFSFKSINKALSSVSKTEHILKTYSKLMQQVEQAQFNAPLLQACQAKLLENPSLATRTSSGLLRKLAMTNKRSIPLPLSVILSLPSVILNEVKNRIATKGKPTAEILHFVQNVPMKFNQCVCFACGTNDSSASTAVKSLSRIIGALDQRFSIMGILLNLFYMRDTRQAMKLERWKRQNAGRLSAWFEALGDFDAFCSYGAYAFNHPDYIYPTLTDSYFEMAGKALGHPLIHRDKCVRNDIHIPKSKYFLIVTGANMAGKSTFLRTIGVNHLLACMGLPVCAESLAVYPALLVTSLRTADSLVANESYFFAELKRLKMIIDRLDAGEKLIIILDEILKGTNSVDKQQGSVALIKQLINKNTCGIIATHDLLLGALADTFPAHIQNKRFEAEIKDDELIFTYQLRDGIAQNMNATFLMKKMGIYPKTLIIAM